MDITLALGGGGAHGYAHVGVLRRLEKEGFRIRALAGTSAGGVVAAIYAAGYSPEEMETRFCKIDQSKLFALSFSQGAGLFSLANATKMLEEYLGDLTFADLKLPCALVAVDVRSSREVILSKGRVVDAILATIAIPGIFPPKMNAEQELVDGGVLDPVPVSVARMLAPRLPVVAIVLNPEMEQATRFSHIPLPVKIPAPIVERFTHFRLTQAINIFLQSVDIGQRMITQLRLEADAPDVIIRPEIGHIGLLDKVDVSAVARLGEEATVASLPDLFKTVSWSHRIGRQIFPPGENRGGKASRNQ